MKVFEINLGEWVGKSTDLEWKEYRFQTGLTGKDFKTSSLKRAR